MNDEHVKEYYWSRVVCAECSNIVSETEVTTCIKTLIRPGKFFKVTKYVCTNCMPCYEEVNRDAW